MNPSLALILALASPMVLAGGSNYGTPAGALARITGQVTERHRHETMVLLPVSGRRPVI